MDTRILSELASEAAGRSVSVLVFDGTRERLDGRANPAGGTIELSGDIFNRSNGAACEVYLHELAHVLLRHTPGDRAEDEANAVTENVRGRVGFGWFGYALRGALLASERAAVLAAIRAATFQRSAVATPTAQRTTAQTPTPTAGRWASRQAEAGYYRRLLELRRLDGRGGGRLEALMRNTIAHLEGRAVAPIVERVSFGVRWDGQSPQTV